MLACLLTIDTWKLGFSNDLSHEPIPPFGSAVLMEKSCNPILRPIVHEHARKAIDIVEEDGIASKMAKISQHSKNGPSVIFSLSPPKMAQNADNGTARAATTQPNNDGSHPQEAFRYHS